MVDPDTPAPTGAVTEIVIDALDPATMDLWRTVGKVAKALDDQHMRWCLVGGLMVALFAIEAGQISRPTTDIDILGDARQRPSGTQWVTEQLTKLGATRQEIGGFEAEKGFRFNIDGQVVDVLAPDGLGRPAMTDAQFQTIQIPGGSQALNRMETVIVIIDGERIPLHRPTLIGAILLKARSMSVHSRPEDQRQDVIQLLGLMTDPRLVIDSLTKAERKWLRALNDHLALDDQQLDATVDAATLRIARAAYPRLIG